MNVQTPNPNAAGPTGEITILQLYDIAIQSCEARDERKAGKVLHTLMNSLDFKYEDMSKSFLGLYKTTLQLVETGDFDQVATIFRGLRQTWQEAMIRN